MPVRKFLRVEAAGHYMKAEDFCQRPGGVGQKGIKGSLGKGFKCSVVRGKYGKGGPFSGAVEGRGELCRIQGGNKGAQVFSGYSHVHEGLGFWWEKDSPNDVKGAVAGFDIDLLKCFSSHGKASGCIRILGEWKGQAQNSFDSSCLNKRGAVLRTPDKVVFQDLSEESAVVLHGFKGFLSKSLKCGIGRGEDRELKMVATEDPCKAGLFNKRGKDGEVGIAGGDFKQGRNLLEVGVQNLIDCMNHPVICAEVGAGDDGLVDPDGTVPSPEKAFNLNINAVSGKERFERAGFEITERDSLGDHVVCKDTGESVLVREESSEGILRNGRESLVGRCQDCDVFC